MIRQAISHYRIVEKLHRRKKDRRHALEKDRNLRYQRLAELRAADAFRIRTNVAFCFFSKNAPIWSFDAWRMSASLQLRTFLDRDRSDRTASNCDFVDSKVSSICDCWPAVSFSRLLNSSARFAGSKCPF
jgi:hypothetical protein